MSSRTEDDSMTVFDIAYGVAGGVTASAAALYLLLWLDRRLGDTLG
jgi:hypothetical protein